jgi:ABC-type lipoprotein release transport system permease subunit
MRVTPIVLTLGWRNLWRRPGRTVLTGSGAALGLGFLLTMLALGDGSHLQMIDAAVRTVSGHVLLQAKDYQRRRGVEQVVSADAAARAAAWARARPEVRAVLPRAFASGLLSSADGATGVSLTGIDPAAEVSISRLATRLAEGRFLRPGDAATAVVGSGVARVLKVRAGSRVVAMARAPEAARCARRCSTWWAWCGRGSRRWTRDSSWSRSRRCKASSTWAAPSTSWR